MSWALALTSDVPHRPDPRPHEEAEPAMAEAVRGPLCLCPPCPGPSAALPRDHLVQQRQIQSRMRCLPPDLPHILPRRPLCPSAMVRDSLVAGAGGRPRLHLVQLVHLVLLQGEAGL